MDAEQIWIPLRAYIQDLLDERFRGSDKYYQGLMDERDKRYKAEFENVREAARKAESAARQAVVTTIAIISIAAVVLAAWIRH